jgi:hypothetical protein
VLEVYRTAVAEYGVPKEMLTDNGRQYTSWRGATRFEAELRKDRVHHFKSRPHHPMTLGKVERFWKTIWEEFLVRAQFDSFEQAQERIRHWVKYYNHKRPHQSLDGLCPADRFFAIAKELRAVIERGIAENVQELALRGTPHDPFYMVGRLGQQAVIIRAEKGQVKMEIDGEPTTPNPELTYQLKGEPHESGSQTSSEGADGVQHESARPSGVERLDGTAAAGGSLSGAEHHERAVSRLARASDAGDVAGAATPAEPGVGPRAGLDGEAGTVVESASPGAADPVGETGEAAGAVSTGSGGQSTDEGEMTGEEAHEAEPSTESAGGVGAAPRGVDRAGAERADHGEGSGTATGRRALAAMVQALADRPGGRPATPPPDPEKQALQAQAQQLERQVTVLEQTLTVRQAFADPYKKS